MTTEKVFEVTLTERKPGYELSSVFGAENKEIVPLLMITMVEGIRSNDPGVIELFSILKSVVTSVELELPLKYNVTERSFNPKDRKQ